MQNGARQFGRIGRWASRRPKRKWAHEKAEKVSVQPTPPPFELNDNEEAILRRSLISFIILKE